MRISPEMKKISPDFKKINPNLQKIGPTDCHPSQVQNPPTLPVHFLILLSFKNKFELEFLIVISII